MGHVRNVTKKIDIPDEPGQFAIIGKLSWKQLARAIDVRSEVGMNRMKAAGGDLVVALTTVEESRRKEREAEARLKERGISPILEIGDGGNAVTVEKPKKPAARVLDRYDLETLLKFGVRNLSYFEKFEKDDIDDLEPKTAEWLGEQLLTFSDVDLDEAEAKNG